MPNDVGMILDRDDARCNLRDMSGAVAAVTDLTTAIKLSPNDSADYPKRSAAYSQ